MANKRIIDLTEIQNIAEDDYVILDSNTSGTRKILASNIGGGGGIDYSTTEQDTGLKWIDGKPIYQKTYHITESAETEEKEYDISSDNVDTMIECTGLVKAGTWGSNNVFTAPRIGDEMHFISLSAKDTAITITAKSYKFTEAYVTLRYTKTTDTV